MSAYIFDTHVLSQGLIPTENREPVSPVLGNYVLDLLVPMQRLNDIDMQLAQNGAPFVIYNSGTTYSIGDRVRGNASTKFQVYESLTNGNVGNNVANITFWANILPNFIGSNERVLYTGSKLSLEWALNHYFGTVFRQPNNLPDIYITDNDFGVGQFYIGNVPTDPVSYVFATYSSGYIENTGVPTGGFPYFTINVPSAYYASLPGYTGANSVDYYFFEFVDNYSYAGITFNVVTY